MITNLSAHALPNAGIRSSRVHPLERMFMPERIAVIGASEKVGSVGSALMRNLRNDRFRVYAVNPNHTEIFGQKTFPNVQAVADAIDLAIIATPASTVPGIVTDCVEAGIQGAIILSAGFRECGPTGTLLEKEIAKITRGKMRIIGPNCLGVMMPHLHLNATFASGIARPGDVGFISQSGALCTAVLDWSLRERVGFSAFVSVGSMLDVSWGDLIYYLGDDPFTKSIVIYMESVGDARYFLSAAREVALSKPIIVLKVGRTQGASKAAASHTGSITGSDDVFDAALHRVGVLRVRTIEELFDMAEVLGKQPRPKGPRLAIITNAGGPGAVATDMLVSTGGKLAELSSETVDALGKILPPHWNHANPIDILGDADPERYVMTLRIIREDPNLDGALVILTPQAMTNPTGTAEKIREFSRFNGKPLLACWMGGKSVQKGKDLLNQANICTFDYPDTAARAFEYMWRYSYNLKGIYETPSLGPISKEGETAIKQAAKIIDAGRKTQRTILTEYESKKIVEAYGIPTVETLVAFTKEDAVDIANKLQYPIVLKLYSETLTHKSDVGGVQLNLQSAKAVSRAWDEIEKNVTQTVGHQHFLGVTVQPMVEAEGYELIFGSSLDPQFGPVLLFGLGGQLVSVLKDRALALPPLNSTLARRLMEQTCIYEALRGLRGRKPVNLPALEQLLVRFSQLVVEQRWIREIEINPLLASPRQLIALDCRIVLHGPDVTAQRLPKLTIRPYPEQYVVHWRTKKRDPVTIRPIRPDDEPLMVKFHQTLSERSVYYRYFTSMKLVERVAHERLTRICFNDYDREIALVAERTDDKTGQLEIIGVARLSKFHATNEAELAIIVSDKWQRQGLGTELLKLLVKIAHNERLERLTAHILQENYDMQAICKKAGFEVHHKSGSECLAEMDLREGNK